MLHHGERDSVVPRKIGKKYKMWKERNHESKKQGQTRRRMRIRSFWINQILEEGSAYESKDQGQSW